MLGRLDDATVCSMAAKPAEQARVLRALADRIERGEQRLPDELAAKLEAEARSMAARRERVDAALERIFKEHAAIFTELAK